MTPSGRTFDLYLLSHMRAGAAVDAALARLGATRAELVEAAAAAERAGFEKTLVLARQYVEVLGAPDRDGPVESVDANSPLAGSRLLHFRRPPWPDLDFAVREAREGYTWGRGFVRSNGVPVPQLASAVDLATWRFVRSELVARHGEPRTEDAWSGWEDLSFELPDRPGGPRRRYLLRFDLDLLQSYEAMA